MVYAYVLQGKEKKVSIDFEPFKPINTSLYLCDNKFHTEALRELLESDEKFGFIIMDGNGALFGVLTGTQRGCHAMACYRMDVCDGVMLRSRVWRHGILVHMSFTCGVPS